MQQNLFNDWFAGKMFVAENSLKILMTRQELFCSTCSFKDESKHIYLNMVSKLFFLILTIAITLHLAFAADYYEVLVNFISFTPLLII
jgi:hypothetical protein